MEKIFWPFLPPRIHFQILYKRKCVQSFDFYDKDHGPEGSAKAFDKDGRLIKEAAIPNVGNASVQTIEIEAENVRELEVSYEDSGAVGALNLECPPEKTPTSTSSSPSFSGS